MAGERRRWVVLAVGMVAMTAGCAFQFGLPFLIPALRRDGLTLAEAGLFTAAPVAGLLATLILWGAAADRWGERAVLTTGLSLAGVLLLTTTSPVGLVLAGAAGASVNAASGRLVLRWFPASERGLAMGLRQTAQPLGVAVAALVLPVLAWRSGLAFLGVFCLAAALLVAIFVRDPAAAAAHAPSGAGSPYRTPELWRIHAASALLIVPQVTVATFALVFLVDAHGWPPAPAGRLLALGQFAGAVARPAAGWWSDRAGSRLRPMRRITLAIAVVLALLAATAGAGVAIAVLLAAAVLTVSPNGLAYTAVAERAGGGWAGRALAIQNTGQNAVGVVTAPLMGLLIATAGYRAAFAAAAAFPLLAAAVIPLRRPATP